MRSRGGEPTMRVCFFGLGSIGKRHLRNLRTLADETNIPLGIYALRSGAHTESSPSAELASIVEIGEAELLTDRYDIAFVTNPTHLHFSTLERVLPLADHIYIEKPLFESAERDFSVLPWKPGHVYHVACPIRRHPAIEYLRNTQKRPVSVRVLCSSYLPDWRQGKDYRTIYSAKNGQGGGVWRDLIHEWDYVRHLWGDPRSVASMRGKRSSLEIDSDDIAAYLADFGDFLLEMHLDYFGRTPRRSIEVFFDDDIVQVDLLSSTAAFLGSRDVIPFPKTDLHAADLRCFIDAIRNGTASDNPPAFAWKTLQIAEGKDLA
jgi:predicted dehydrogenase